MSARHFRISAEYAQPKEWTTGRPSHDFGAVSEYVFTDPGYVFTFVMEGEKVSFTAREVFQIIKALKGLKACEK